MPQSVQGVGDDDPGDDVSGCLILGLTVVCKGMMILVFEVKIEYGLGGSPIDCSDGMFWGVSEVRDFM